MRWWMIKRRVHVSWLLALLSFGCIAGVGIAPILPRGIFGGIAWLMLGGAVAAVGIWRGKLYAIPIMVIAGVVIGLGRSEGMLLERAVYGQLAGQAVVIEGEVSESPSVGKKRGMTVNLAVHTVEGRTLPGVVWVSMFGRADIRRGDMLQLTGKLEPGFGSYAASMHDAELLRITRPTPGDIGARTSEWFNTQVQRVIPGEPGALGIGFLTGQNQLLSPELEDAMKLAGLTHIVVASGYNLTILVRLSRRLFVRVSKYMAAFAGFLMIGGFLVITGLSPSMSRAGLVAGLSLLAWYYGRRFHPLVLLPLVAAITACINPSYMWGDLGWLLSFAAFAGVMMLAPLLQAYFFGKKESGFLRQLGGETIAAQLATLPIIAVAFGQVSNVALFANLLVVPLVPCAMLLVFLAGMFAFVVPPLGLLIGWCANLVLNYMIGIVHFFSSQPWAVVSISLEWPWACFVYAVMVGAGWWFWRKTKYDFRASSIVD